MSAKRLTAAEVVVELEGMECFLRAENNGMRQHGDGRYVAQADGIADAIEVVREHLIETPEQSRERFERWRRSQGDTAATLARRHADGSYEDIAFRLMWTTWEASRTFRSEQES